MAKDQENIFDYIIIGSGFGGSVSALRLCEKGYRVLLVEAGKRYEDEDFPKNNREIKKWLFWPRIGCFGIMRMSLFRHAFFLSGAGLGGGSLVYANTLLRPPSQFYEDNNWPKEHQWEERLKPYYEKAEKMLGLTESPRLEPADITLKKLAQIMGREKSFHQTKVGVYFAPEQSPPTDPYFSGRGPLRKPCNFCGNCMVGCRVGAKNTLMKNYLYFAQNLGLKILTEAQATKVEEEHDGQYRVTVKQKGLFKTYNTKGVVFSAGVLGTIELLLKMKDCGHLPKLSSKLGHYLRTNSEALVGLRVKNQADFSKGIAISAGFYPDPQTHVEIVRYGEDSDMIGMISTLMVGGGPHLVRIAKFFWQVFLHPYKFFQTLRLKNWAKESIILLVMQNLDNHLKFVLRRPWYWPFKKVMSTKINHQAKVPVFLPTANLVAQKMAKELHGTTLSSVPEVLLNKTTTAHILGGAIMAQGPEHGVIDYKNQVFGYKNMYVIDGSMIPANLGVNPSLTITAMAEHAMSFIGNKTS